MLDFIISFHSDPYVQRCTTLQRFKVQSAVTIRIASLLQRVVYPQGLNLVGTIGGGGGIHLDVVFG